MRLEQEGLIYICLEKEEEVVKQVTSDRYGRGKHTIRDGIDIEISQRSVAQILKKNGYKKVKAS